MSEKRLLDIDPVANISSPLAPRGCKEDGGRRTYTVDVAIDKLGFGPLQWRVTAVGGILWAADGVESTILAIVAPEARCVFNVSPWAEALLTTMVFTGMLLGAAPWGRVADLYGRKVAITLSTIMVIYFGILSGFAPSYIWLLVLRAIFGFGLAGLPQSVTYFMEMVPTKSRSTCSAFLQFVYSLGMIAAAGMSIGVMAALNWRYLLAFSVAGYVLVLPLMFTVPESPHYFITRGKVASALASLTVIAKGNRKELPSGHLVQRCNADMQHMDGRDGDIAIPPHARRSTVRDLFRPLSGLVTTLLLWLIWFLTSFTYFGILLMTTELLEMYHSVEGADSHCMKILPADKANSCHHLTSKDYTDVLWTTLAELPAILICYGLNKLLPRRPTIVIHGLCASVLGAMLIICPLSRAGTVGLIFAMRSFLSSLFITMYLYTSEAYPTSLRATGLGAAYTWGRVGGIATPFIAQVMLRRTIRGAKLFYALTSLVIAIAGALLPRETKGRSMDDHWD